MTGLRVEDDFAGPGGWDVAAQALGLTPIGYEWDKHAVATARAAGHIRVQGDLTMRKPALSLLNGTSRFYLYIASPSCQGFSMAGLGAGRTTQATAAIYAAVQAIGDGASYDDVKPAILAATVSDKHPQGDDRVPLVAWPLYWALKMQPENIAWEQVPAVLPLWEAMGHILTVNGYNVATGSLQAEQYDTPQTRKRAILVASRTHGVELPRPVRRKYRKGITQAGCIAGQEHLLPWLSMADALGWGMTAQPSITLTSGSGRQGGPDPLNGGSGARATLKAEREAGRFVVRTSMGEPKSDGRNGSHELDPFTRPAHTVTTKVGEWQLRSDAQPNATVRHEHEPAPTIKAGHSNGERVWEPNLAHPDRDQQTDASWVTTRPSPTIVGSFAPDVVAAPGYRGPGDGPRQNAVGSVRVTVQEAALLQGFPADYPWKGTKTAAYRQVGDAVPPPLAWHVLRAALGLPSQEWPAYQQLKETA